MALFNFSKTSPSSPLLDSGKPISSPTDPAATLGKYLILGETLKWSAASRLPFAQQIRPALPFIIIFLIVYIFLSSLFFMGGHRQSSTRESTPVTTEVKQDQPPVERENRQEASPILTGIMIPLFVSSFFTCWCLIMYSSFGRYLTRTSLQSAQSCYGLTQHRILWVNGEKKVKVHSYTFDIIRNIQLEELGDGVGNIYISLNPSVSEIYNPFNPPTVRVPQLIIRSIPDAARVFNLIFEAQVTLLTQRDQRDQRDVGSN